MAKAISIQLAMPGKFIRLRRNILEMCRSLCSIDTGQWLINGDACNKADHQQMIHMQNKTK